MAWLIALVVLLLVIVVLWLFYWTGCADFWRQVQESPDVAMAFFEAEKDCWAVFPSEPGTGYRAALPPGDWAGPFSIGTPTGYDAPVVVFGKIPDYEESQKRFLFRIKGEV